MLRLVWPGRKINKYLSYATRALNKYLSYATRALIKFIEDYIKEHFTIK
ncbi:hypothetical protein LTSEALA_1155 [Salmonella enterica subsp. enterica serovar Alachua str. R6-377]|uniref:Uncharacterized protein n=1 Tax=Salmonella enterica subsp. enterica serovar Alachua str. R6-377 TaxID=913241 RepID=G5LL35_SALET|nr:hypothetical protein LTSEALA_1155 [Salmonella enterica subsp. enterica serovar Alachua str. R6-377]